MYESIDTKIRDETKLSKYNLTVRNSNIYYISYILYEAIQPIKSKRVTWACYHNDTITGKEKVKTQSIILLKETKRGKKKHL